MYRPFVTCEDPKGVAERGTIRKSKSCVPRTEDKAEKSRIEKHSKTSSMAYKAEEEATVSIGAVEDYHVPSSCQLLEICRGAQKLNRMIDAWSKEMSYGGGRPKEIAKDLLKGALDLQESLVMLGKLQEASNYMSQLKKKHKEKAKRGRIDAVGRKAASSFRYGDLDYQMGLQKPRLSADGNSTEELKKVIRDGLARQNLLPNTSSQDRSYSRRTHESASDIPSTSSNQPSMAQFTDSNIADSSSPNVQPKKEKGPNLIARLMGLEEFPMKPLQQPDLQKQVTEEKILSPRRPTFEIEMPKLKKHHHRMQREDSEQRTLKEVLDTMQFKGLLKSSSMKVLKPRYYQSGDDFYPYQRPIEEVPPIVLIKPMRAPRRESKEAPRSSGLEEETWNRKMMTGKMNAQEGPIETFTGYKDSNLSTTRMQSKMDMQEAQVKRRSQEESAKDCRDEAADLEEKEVRMVDEREQAADVTKKLEAEAISMKRLTLEEGPKERNKVIVRSEGKEVNTTLKSSFKLKTSGPVVHHQQQKREITDMRVDKVQTMAPNGKKPVEREIAKPKNAPRSQDHSKVMSRSQRKNESTTTMTQNQVPREQNATAKTILENTTQSRSHNSKYGKRKEKTVGGTMAAKTSIENIGPRDDDRGILHTYVDDSVGEVITSSPADQLSPVENANASEVQAEGDENNSQSSLSDAIIPTPESDKESQNSLCDVSIPTSECQKDAKSSVEACNPISYIGRDGTGSKAENHSKVMLLSNQSFLTRADELFHLELGSHTISPTSSIEDSKSSESKLVLDYANEIMERRSLPDSQAAAHPLVPANRVYSRISLSLDQLAEEICIGIETLRSCIQVAAADSLSADTLYATQERDMWCKGVLDGTWESGWRSGFSVHDVEQAVIDVENLLLLDLINEVFL